MSKLGKKYYKVYLLINFHKSFSILLQDDELSCFYLIFLFMPLKFQPQGGFRGPLGWWGLRVCRLYLVKINNRADIHKKRISLHFFRFNIFIYEID